MIHAVILDMDGTLLDSETVSMEATSRGFAEIFGRELTDKEHSEMMGRPVQLLMKQHYGKKGEEAYLLGREYFSDNMNKIGLFPGIGQLLTTLRNNDLKLGLVTSSHREDAKFFLEKTGISEYFEVKIAQEDTERHKPHPEPLLKCINMLDAKSEQSVYIGDQPYDIRAALSAGMKSIGATWGPGDPDVLGAEHATEICHDPLDIINIIKRL